MTIDGPSTGTGGSHLPVLLPDAPSREAVRQRGAHAYARLLVGDIRLYHEEDVIAGRILRDLPARLEGPLKDARALFLRRYRDAEFFDSEVARILAGGVGDRAGGPGESR